MTRRARVERKTKESDIVVELDLDGTGRVDISTGVPFFDHMLTALGSHASFDLTVHAKRPGESRVVQIIVDLNHRAFSRPLRADRPSSGRRPGRRASRGRRR